jgi:uncharacterized protein YjdB
MDIICSRSCNNKYNRISNRVTGVAAGTTVITYQNTNGCLKTATVTVNPLPTITGTLTVCEAGSTTQLTGSATAHAITPWTSSVPGVATINSSGLVTGVAAGTTVITYQNTNGCTKTATVTVNPLPTITGTLTVCEAGSTTQLTGSATAHAITPWTSSVPGVATINSSGLVTGVAAGTTVITYQNTNGCLKTATVTVNPLPTITGTLTVCEAGSTTQLTGSATAHATTPWTSSVPGVATINSSGLVNGVAAGTTVITYQNTNGCLKTATVTVNPLPTITGTLTVCEAGSTTQLTGSATAHAITPWTSSVPGVATINSSGLVTGVAAGTTVITYQNTNGCLKTATVTVNPLPTITGTLTVCEAGSTTQLTGSATAHATTPWTSSVPGVATINSSGLVTGIAAGTTVITYQNTNGCTKTATVTVNPLPTITGTLTVCEAGSTTQLTGSATAHAITPWTSSVPGVATINSSGLVTGVAAGTTVITYQNTNGCLKTATVTVNPLPTITGTLTVCEAGSTTQLTGSATAHATTPWTSSVPGVATINSSGLVTGIAAGTTVITYQNTNGCTKTATVTVNPLPTITGTLTVCEAGSTTQLTGSATAHATTPWTSLNNGIATISTTGLVTGVAAGTTTIIYQNTNGCIKTATVTVNALPVATISYNAGSFCNLGTATINQTGQTGGTYSAPAGLQLNTSSGSVDLAASTPGTYSVLYTFNAPVTGCVNTTSTSITVYAVPVIVTQPSGAPQTWCKGQTASPISITTTAIPGSETYQWFSNTVASTIGGTPVSGATNASYIPSTTTAGVLYYYVVITNANNCSIKSTLAGSITVNDIPVITINPSTTGEVVCDNATPGSINVNATTATGTITNYQWYSNTTNANSGGTSIAGANGTSYVPSVAADGTLYYYAVVTNSFGCNVPSATSGAITVYSAPVINTQPSSAPQVLCRNTTATALTVIATAGSGTISYQWYSNTNASNSGGTPITGATGSAYMPSSSVAGVLYYYVVVSNSNGCTVTSAISGSVTINELPSVTIQPSTTPQIVCNNSTPTTIIIAAIPGSGAISTYQWYINTSSSNSGGVPIAGANGTNYAPSLTTDGTFYYYTVVTNTNSCITTSLPSGAVTIYSAPVISSQPSSAPQVLCRNTTATALSVTATAGSGTISYQWYSNTNASNSGGTPITGATGTSYTPSSSAAGVLYYYVVVSNSNGCTVTSAVSGSITINELPFITISPSAAPQVVCNNATPVSFTIAAFAGSGAITNYQWYNNATNSNTGGTAIGGANTTTLIPSVSTVGTLYYYAVVTNSNGCISVSNTSGSVTVNPAPVITIQPSNIGQSVCVNNPALSVSANAGVGATITYQWYSNTTASTSGGTLLPGATSSVFSPTSNEVGTKYFYVVITNNFGCVVTSNVSGSLIVNALPIASISYPANPFCATGTTSVSRTGQAGGTYISSAGLNINSSTGEINLGGSVAGNYTITYNFNDPVTGCVNTTSTNITIKPMPLAQINGNNNICATTSLLFNATDAGAGASYDWYGPYGFILNGTTLNINNVSSNSAGPYQLAVTINGCTSTVTTTLNVKPLPVAVINGVNNICEAASTTLSATNAGATATYAWNGPGGTTSNTQNIDLNNIPLSYNGSYNLTVTLNGCTATAVHNLLVKPLPVAQIIGSTNICEASTLQLNAAIAGNGAGYAWVGPNNFTSASNSISIGNVTANTAGNYGLTVTLNGCISVASTAVIIRPLPLVVINGQTIICEKETLSLAAADAGTDAVYSWYYNNISQSIQSTMTISNAVPSNSGIYTLVVSRLGCSKQTTADVLVKPLPLTHITGSSVICEATTLSLSADDAGVGAAYTWILPNNNANIASQNLQLPNATPLQTGNYTLIVTKNGCMNTTMQNVFVTPLPSAVINGNTIVCESSSLNLIASDAGTGSNYFWQTATGEIVNNRTLKLLQMTMSMAGTYQLTVVKNGCQKQASTIVTVKKLATAAINAVDALCQTETLLLNASSPDPSVAFTWAGPSNYTAAGANNTIPISEQIIPALIH